MDKSKKDKLDINLDDLNLEGESKKANAKKEKLNVDDLSEDITTEEIIINNEDLIEAETASQHRRSSEPKRSIFVAPPDSRSALQTVPTESAQRSGRLKPAHKAMLIAVLCFVLIAILLYNIYPTDTPQLKDQVNIAFSTNDGIEYESPTGISVKIMKTAFEQSAKLQLSVEIYEEPKINGILKVFGVYDVEIISEDELKESPVVKLEFTVPPDLNADKTLILLEVSPSGFALPGGEVEVTDGVIALELTALSRYVMAVPYDENLIKTVIREPDEPVITDEGHAQYEITLEREKFADPGFGRTPWVSMEISRLENPISVEVIDDWFYDRYKPRHSYISPQEVKEITYKFYGVGGSSMLTLSPANWDALTIAWLDFLYQSQTGEPLPWPLNAEQVREDNHLAVLLKLYGYLTIQPQRLDKNMSLSDNAIGGIYSLSKTFWETTKTWADSQGHDDLLDLIGSEWSKFARESDLFVAQLVYAFVAETDYKHEIFVHTLPQLEIEAESPVLEAGEATKMIVTVETNGTPLSFDKIWWEVSGGGNIDDEGLFQSNADADGDYQVEARLFIMGSDGKMQSKVAETTVSIKDLETETISDEVVGVSPEENFNYTLSSGDSHTLAIQKDGSLSVWGGNDRGQLGLDDGADFHNQPVKITNLSDIIAVQAGSFHSLALKTDGTVWAWGGNSEGQLGDGSTNDREQPVKIDELNNIKALGAGRTHSLAICSEGTLWSWGSNSEGELGDNSRTDRTVPVKAADLNNVIQVAGGDKFSIALTNDGSVWSWGSNMHGQLGNGKNPPVPTKRPQQVKNLSDIEAISAGKVHVLVLKQDGTVWAWGGNSKGQLGDGETGDRYRPNQVLNLQDIIAVYAGDNHSYALKKDGTVWSWGANSEGQLGDGTTDNRSIPVQVSGLEEVVHIVAGSRYGYALMSDGSIWAWGFNEDGILGIADATVDNQLTPAKSLFSRQ